MEMKNKQTVIGILIALLLALIFGYYLYTSGKGEGEIVPDQTGEIVVENDGIIKGLEGTDSQSSEVATLNEDDVEIKEIPISDDSSVPAPDINRPLVFGDTMSEDARIIYREKIGALTEKIKETGGTVSEWLSLGILWKQIGDYEGARIAWEYVATIRPKSSIAFLNLGDLYHYYLKNFSKAESNFKMGIMNDPSHVSAYLGLHELYKYSYKQNTAAAANILLEGLDATSDSINILVPLAMYYAEKEDIENARKYYEKALQKAKESNDTARAALIEEELSRL